MEKEYPKRGENYSILQRQLKERTSFAWGMPNTLIIEPGAVCSLGCPFCPQSSPSFDFSREMLTLGNFQKIIDYFEDFVDTVMLFNWGEPLLNPALGAMVKYASERKMATIIHSNFNHLKEEFAEDLILGGLTQIVASIDGTSQESYQVYRRGGSFASALANLKLFCDKKKTLARGNPDILWKFLVFRHNEGEMDKARGLAAEIGVKIDFQFAVAPGEFNPTLSEYNNDGLKEKFIKYYGLPCEQPWRAVNIHADGTVLPCCMVSQTKYGMGNFFREDFRSIWNNDRYRFLREVISGRKEADASLNCANCLFGKPVNKEG